MIAQVIIFVQSYLQIENYQQNSSHISLSSKDKPTFLQIWLTDNIWYNHLAQQKISHQGLRIQLSAKTVSNNTNSRAKIKTLDHYIWFHQCQLIN